MNARAEHTNKIIEELSERVKWLEMQLVGKAVRRGEFHGKEWQSFNKVTDLKQGDIVQLRHGHEPFQVTMVYGDHASVIRTHEVTNPLEWEVLR